LEEAAAYLEETGVGLEEYLELVRDRSRELFGLDQPAEDERGDQRRVVTVWSLSLDRVHQEAPAAEALLNLCAFFAPDIPRGLPGEQPQVLPEELAQAVSETLAYTRTLAVMGRYSLATVSPRRWRCIGWSRRSSRPARRAGRTALGRGRGGPAARELPNDSWEVPTWSACERLLPHVLTVAGHADRLGVAGEQVGWLLDRASTYLHERGQYRQARPSPSRAWRLPSPTPASTRAVPRAGWAVVR
jgi:hypothetical protein